MRNLRTLLLGLLAVLMLAPVAGAGEKIAIGYAHGLLSYLPYDVARYLKLFEKEGLDVTYVRIGGSRAAKALIAGSIDFSGNSADHAIKAAARGKALRMVVGFQISPSWTVVVSSKFRGKIKSLRDLKGHKVGVTLLGSGSHLTLRYLLKKEGIPESSMEIVPIGYKVPGMLATLKNRQVDATMSFEPLTSLLIPSKDYYTIVDLRKRADMEKYYGSGDFAYTGVLTRPDVIKNRPGVVQKVVNAIVKANRWVASHSASEVVAVFPKGLIKDKKSFATSLAHLKEIRNTTGLVTRKSVKKAIGFHKILGTLKKGKPVSVADVLDDRFVKKALGSN